MTVAPVCRDLSEMVELAGAEMPDSKTFEVSKLVIAKEGKEKGRRRELRKLRD
jgi:hypothetical protein